MRRWDREALERLAERGQLSRRQFVAGLAALGLSATAIADIVGHVTSPTPAEADVPQYVVLIVLDGFRADYRALAEMPALAALQSRGTTYERAWVGQVESVTPVSHATLATGVVPRRHGIIGFEWRDPQTGGEAMDGWDQTLRPSPIEHDLATHGSISLAAALKARDPSATVVSLSSEKVYAADAFGGPAADYILYHRWAGHGRLVPAAVPGHVPAEDFFHHSHLRIARPFRRFTEWDYLSGLLALTAIDTYRPRLLLVNLPGADVYGHPYGGPATPSVMRQIVDGLDRNIARVVRAYRDAGIDDRTLFVVVGDHGMAPNYHMVSDATMRAAVTRGGGHHWFHLGGTASFIYLHDPGKAAAVAESVLGLPEVVAAYHHVRSRDGGEFVPVSNHIGPDLDAAYRYLLRTFASPEGPDVAAPFREQTIGRTARHAYGHHGGLNWGVQHVPLIMSGPGVRAGVRSAFPARLVDVAPTVLRTLGLPVGRVDGLVLADALHGSSARDVAAQRSVESDLTRYQDALIARSLRDVEEDRRNGVRCPPSLAPDPNW